MSELQNDSDELEVNDESQIDDDLTNESEEVENPEQDSDLATDSDDRHEEQDQADVNQEAIQKVINKKHFEAKEAERKAEALQKRLDEIEAKQFEQSNQPQNVPPLPDVFDDDYEQRIAERDRIITQNAQIEFTRKQQEQQSLYQQQIEQQKQAEALNEKLTSYTNKAKELNISSSELQEAANIVGMYGLNEQVQLAIVSDDKGPLITKYLAKHPQEVEALNASLSQGFVAAGQVYEAIKLKAANSKPKTTNAPTPPTRVDGGAVDSDSAKYPHSKGAKFS